MEHHLNINVNILMGGEYTGGPDWNKKASQVDKCFKIYYLNDGAYFSRVFSKIHKCSPVNYRKKFRKKFP